MKKSRLLIAGSAICLAMFSSAAVYAQDTDETAPAAEDEATDEEGDELIVVTGSRIRRDPNVEGNLPTTTLGGEEFFQQGNQNIGDTLNELPQLRSTFAQQNPGLGIGIAGLNLLDLRGLGTVRTLVLVNGRRHVAADILNNAVSPDVNTIPNDLLERVEIVTGGNSAIYGSDAIAGVVNFVLRRDYDGVQIRGNAAISEEGFGGNQYASVMAGKNFADGRGNVTGHIEYAHQERIFGSDIESFRRVDGFFVSDIDTGGLPSASDGFPDNVFGRDFRSASINVRGLVPITQNGTTPGCGVGLVATNGAPGNSPLGLPYNCTFIFNDSNRLLTQTGTRTGAGVIGGIIGGNGQTGREGKLLSVLPSLERFNANLLARYEFSPAAEVFLEAKATRVKIRGSNFGPSFVQGTFGTLDYRERTRLDNPFLNAADRTAIASALLASGCNPSLTAACSVPGIPSTFVRSQSGPAGQTFGISGPLNASDIAQITAGTYRFVTSRSLADAGSRDEEFERDTYRVVGGFRGTFNDDWSYEISGNYGITEEKTTAFGFINRQRASLAFDAGLNPITGTIQCRSQFDPAAAIGLQPAGFGVTAAQAANNAARLAADIAACVPYNPFGSGSNQAAVNYFSTDYQNNASLDQLVFSGFVSGDTSGFFNLPGGPVRFAVGGEYRREKLQFRQDPLIFTIKTNAVEIPDILPAAFEVKEAFGEIQIPLLADMPFFHELTVSGAGRVAEYQGGTGTVYAYNAGVEWAPIEDIRFRGNYGRSVRAPNVSETASPLVANFAPGFQDPCSPARINDNATRPAACLADLGAAVLGAIVNATYSLPVVSGSNPNLAAEESDSYTVGVVLQPRFVPGLSVTVDYYDITLNGQIAATTAQAIVNNCYDFPQPNVFCAQFSRNRTTGPGPNAETAGAVINNSLIQAPLNFASRKRRGVDVEARYGTTFGVNNALTTRLIYSHQFQNSNFEDITNPAFENRLLSELGDPQDEFRFSADLKLDRITLGYELRYIGSMLTTTYENLNPLNGRVPGNLDVIDIQEYPEVFYHDARVDFAIGEDQQFNFFVGVDNVFNTQPPLGTTATGGGSSIYSIRGRNFFSGFRARF